MDYLKDKERKGDVKLGSLLDIGIGTGLPLRKVASRLPVETRILGVDIDANYVKAA